MRFILILVLSTLLLIPAVPQALEAQRGTVIFLVRHAERADDGAMAPQMAMDPQMREDPPLSEAGQTGRYALERHVCVDTSAAGGNAALLADAGAA